MSMRELETSIVRCADALLQKHRNRLLAGAVTWHGPIVEFWASEPTKYSSELRITILKDGKIADILEFHIFREGKPVVTEAEAANWLNTELEGLCMSERKVNSTRQPMQ